MKQASKKQDPKQNQPKPCHLTRHPLDLNFKLVPRRDIPGRWRLIARGGAIIRCRLWYEKGILACHTVV